MNLQRRPADEADDRLRVFGWQVMVLQRRAGLESANRRVRCAIHAKVADGD